MNNVTISGRLGKDPELSKTNNGHSVCNFSIAVDEYKPNEDAPTNWIQCQIWNKQAEYLEQNAGVGDKVFIQGRIKQDTWEDGGITKYKVYVIVERLELGTKASKKSSTANNSIKVKEVTEEDYHTDEDLPF